MKKLFILIMVLFITASSFAQVETVVTIPGHGFAYFPTLVKLPDDYATTNTKYPLLIFLHGAGEGGASNGSQLGNIYNSSSAGGPAYFIEHGQWPTSFINPTDGLPYKFIVVSPQAQGWSLNGGYVMDVTSYLTKNYRIDSNRIYITGLSAGGQGVYEYAIHATLTVPTSFPLPAAAVVPMSMASGLPSTSGMNTVKSDNVAVWGFGSSPSDMHGENTQKFAAGTNGRFTNYAGGHCCWNNFYNPNYKEVVNGKTMNIYEWMLTNSRGTTTQPPPTTVPIPVVKKAVKITILYSDGTITEVNL